MPQKLFHDATRGLSLIELVCSIVILGIVFLFALNGGESALMRMRALAASYELEQFQRFVLTYQVDYSQLPGDDPNAAQRWGRNITLTALPNGIFASTSGNGKIEGRLYDLSSPTGEQFIAWQDLRYAGSVSGDRELEGATALPENPFGGFYAFDEGNLGQTGGSLCATRIPGAAAEYIDRRLDDGRINAGKVVATSKFSIDDDNHFEAPDSAPYDIEKEYIICLPMLP